MAKKQIVQMKGADGTIQYPKSVAKAIEMGAGKGTLEQKLLELENQTSDIQTKVLGTSGSSGDKQTYNKDNSNSLIYKKGVFLKATDECIGRNIRDISTTGGGVYNNIYKINITGSNSFDLTSFRTTSGFGSLITDKGGIVTRALSNSTESDGTIQRVKTNPGDSYLYYGTNASTWEVNVYGAAGGFDTSSHEGRIQKLESEMSEIQKGGNEDSSSISNSLITAILNTKSLNDMDKVYSKNYIRADQIGDLKTEFGGNDVVNYKIPLEGCISLKYVSFKSSMNYGCVICNRDNKVIWAKTNTNNDGDIIQLDKIPDGASYLIYSTNSAIKAKARVEIIYNYMSMTKIVSDVNNTLGLLLKSSYKNIKYDSNNIDNNEQLYKGSYIVAKEGKIQTVGGGSDVFNYKIPIKGCISLKYTAFKSSSGYGCVICNDNDIVVWARDNTIMDGSVIEVADIPADAAYFIYSTNGMIAKNKHVEILSSNTYSDIADIENEIKDINKVLHPVVDLFTYYKADIVNKSQYYGDVGGLIQQSQLDESSGLYIKKTTQRISVSFSVPGISHTIGSCIQYVNNESRIVKREIENKRTGYSVKYHELVFPPESDGLYISFRPGTLSMLDLDGSQNLVSDDINHLNEQQVLSGVAVNRLVKSQAGNSKGGAYSLYSLNDFGEMPSCRASDDYHFLADGLDASGAALIKSTDVFTKYDDLISAYPNYIKKQYLGKDASGQLDIFSYTFEPKYYKQCVYLQAGVHGWEPEGIYALAEIMYLIATSHGHTTLYPNGGDNCVLKYLRENIKFIIVPIVNPWGFNNRGDCGIDKRSVAQNNSNGVQLNATWNDPKEPEAIYVTDIIQKNKAEISAAIDMHTTVWKDTRTRYGCFYGGVADRGICNKTVYRTYEWLYQYYNEVYPDIVQGDQCPNPMGAGWASIGTMDGCFSGYVTAHDIAGVTMEFSDHVWSEDLHTTEALSVAVNMYLNMIIQLINDKYKEVKTPIPPEDIFRAKG